MITHTDITGDNRNKQNHKETKTLQTKLY